MQICDPARPTTLVSGGPGGGAGSSCGSRTSASRSSIRPSTAWRLLEPWGCDAAERDARAARGVHVRGALGRAWRRGRGFVAGDAAHLMPPFAGQGMCSGIRDAANLAWKLDLVLAGKAPDALLDTYGAERAPNVRQAIDFSVGLGRVICVPDPAAAAERDAAMIPAASDGQMTVAAAAARTRDGHLAPGRCARGTSSSCRAWSRTAAAPAASTTSSVGAGCCSAPHVDPLASARRRTRRRFASIGGIVAHVWAPADDRRRRRQVRAIGSGAPASTSRCNGRTSTCSEPPRRETRTRSCASCDASCARDVPPS